MQGKAAHGFTLIEVLIASTILVVGVLAVGSSVMAANRSTETSGARSAATAIARRVLEQARATPAPQLAPGTAQASLATGTPDLRDADPALAGWQVARGGMEFLVTVSSCNDDDPYDGYGERGADYCTAGAASTPADRQPTDFVEVAVDVAWSTGEVTRSVKQASRISAGSSGGGTDAAPSAGTVSMTSPTACSDACPVMSDPSVSSISLAASTPSSVAGVEWLVDGSPTALCPPVTATCAGSGSDWSFLWGIGTVAVGDDGACIAGEYLYDGVHTVGVRGYDSAGRAGEIGSLPVTINRCPAIAPAGFNATGRDQDTAIIDTEWQASPEGDVIGYRVYREASGGERTPVCPPSVTAGEVIALDAAHECVDNSPPSYSSSSGLVYGVYALDRDASGNLREGAIAFTPVDTGNRAPNAPTDLTATGSSEVTLSWTLPSVEDHDSGDGIESFRIYRRAGTASGTPTHADRLVRENRSVLCTGSTCTFVDATPLATATYWVTAVDGHMRESEYLGPGTP